MRHIGPYFAYHFRHWRVQLMGTVTAGHQHRDDRDHRRNFAAIQRASCVCVRRVVIPQLANTSIAIAATGILAMALLAWCKRWRRNTFRTARLETSNVERADSCGIRSVVGVAIHYSAIIIGVSFGAVFSVAETATALEAIVAVMIQQAVLTRAAWVLVNEYSVKAMPPTKIANRDLR